MKLQIIKILNKYFSSNIPFLNQETLIGKWINGENLYRIVLTGEKTADSNLEIPLPAGAKVVDFHGVIISSNNYRFPLTHYEGPSMYHRTCVTNGNKLQIVGANNMYNMGTVFATVYYYK